MQTTTAFYQDKIKLMNNRTGIAILVIVLVIILGFTLYWQFGRSQKASVIESQPQTTTQNVPQDTQLITALHQYKNGKHIVAGQVDLPTPCHILSKNVSMTDTTPKQVTIAFTSTSNDADVCAQVITPARFKVEFMAPEDAVISATWNGVPVRLNLVPAGPDQNLENFEIYIKG